LYYSVLHENTGVNELIYDAMGSEFVKLQQVKVQTMSLRCTDTSDLRHFEPKTFRQWWPMKKF